MQGSCAFLKGRWLLFLVMFSAIASCGGDESIEAGSQGCTDCHTTQATAWSNFSSHQGIYSCTFCHEEADPSPGEGHRTSPWCNQCHSEAGHPPERPGVSSESERFRFTTCLTCHDPHGSRNIYLIRERLLIGQGETVPIDFRNIEGRADFSYAERGTEEGGRNGLEPGTGLCEVCHTRTEFYNRTATGGNHYAGRCAGCHNHAIGFGVEPR